MRKYRIRIETRGDGQKVYYPEIKGRLWGWNPLKEHYRTHSEVMECWSEYDARNEINNHKQRHMHERVEKIETRYL